MPANPSTRWYWNDWENDQALKLCGWAAQGLWMRMLSIAARSEPIGYLSAGERPLTDSELARLVGGVESEVSELVGELERNHVFSRDRKGRIYSRRMVRDEKAHISAVKNGKKGGNPRLTQHAEISSEKPYTLTPGQPPRISPLIPFTPYPLPKEKGGEISGVAEDGKPRAIAETMVAAWKDKLGGLLPVPIKLTAALQRSAILRWRDEFHSDQECWLSYLSAIRSSRFLTGENDRGWRADFEWALRPRSVEKVRQGCYDNRRPAAAKIIGGITPMHPGAGG